MKLKRYLLIFYVISNTCFGQQINKENRYTQLADFEFQELSDKKVLLGNFYIISKISIEIKKYRNGKKTAEWLNLIKYLTIIIFTPCTKL